MQIYEKIKFFRTLKDLTQDQMAEKLDMSPSGYGSIERGETDVQMSRLEQIAKIFEIDLLGLLSFGEKNVIYFTGDNNHHIWHNNQHVWQILNSKESTEIAHELEKYKLLNAQKDKEINLLYEQVAQLKQIVELEKK